MHDVLAHRLSLLAVHAGALEYRTDASSAEIAEAGIIRANAHDALEDLRSVISVLREEDEADPATPERPQPTLADLPGLISESRRAGLSVSVDLHGDTADRAADLAPAIGRTVYRIVQESLTNVRKHAPYARVSIDLDGRCGEGIEVLVCNDVARSGRAPTALAGAGSGLAGLSERAALAGGRLEAGPDSSGDSFTVRAWLPWPRAAASAPEGGLPGGADRPVRPAP